MDNYREIFDHLLFIFSVAWIDLKYTRPDISDIYFFSYSSSYQALPRQIVFDVFGCFTLKAFEQDELKKRFAWSAFRVFAFRLQPLLDSILLGLIHKWFSSPSTTEDSTEEGKQQTVFSSFGISSLLLNLFTKH